MSTKPETEREELIQALVSERRWHDLTDAQLDRAAALLAEAGKAGGEVDEGPWSAALEDGKVFVESADFSHDVRLYINGDFATTDESYLYACDIARRLNTRPQQAAQVAQPLTPERVLEMSRSNYWHNSITTLSAYTEGVRDAEAAHGIKKDQP